MGDIKGLLTMCCLDFTLKRKYYDALIRLIFHADGVIEALRSDTP